MSKKILIGYFMVTLFVGINLVNASTNLAVAQENFHNQEMIEPYSLIKTENSIGEAASGNSKSQNTAVDYCGGLESTFVFIGHLVTLAKIFIPIVIIGFGMFDFFKTIVGSKDDEIKKSLKSLIMRCIAGVCIFFLPAVISVVFSWIDGWENDYQGKTDSCFKCIWDVSKCTK